MDEASISLRAHHGLCLHFFQGKGYSEAFVENMARKKAMLEENPLVRLTDQADEICRACPITCAANANPPRRCGAMTGQCFPCAT